MAMTYGDRVGLMYERDRMRREREHENDYPIEDRIQAERKRQWEAGYARKEVDKYRPPADGGGDQKTHEPRSNISFFASDGNGRISRSTADGRVVDTDPWGNALRQQQMSENGARYGQAFKDQKATHDEMAQVMETARRENAKRRLALANDVASAMSFAQGGVIPEPLRNLINRRHGFDGQTTGILPSSGFTSGGSFDLILGNGVDQNGNVVTSRQSFDPMSQYMMMGTNRAAFSDDDRAKMREKLSKQYGFSEKELAGIDAGFQQMALASGGGRGNGGSGVEIARINAEQKEKDRILREKIANDRAAFNREKMEFYVANNLNKEAKELFSGMSDEDKEYVKAKYKEKAMAWLGEEKKPQPSETQEEEKIPGYSPERIAELKKRGYRWDGKKWVK